MILSQVVLAPVSNAIITALRHHLHGVREKKVQPFVKPRTSKVANKFPCLTMRIENCPIHLTPVGTLPCKFSRQNHDFG